MNLLDRIEYNFTDSIATQQTALSMLQNQVALAAQMMTHCLLAGGRVFSCGSGSSACDAEHFSNLMLFGFETQRPGLPALTLGTGGAGHGAEGVEPDQVFAKQLQTLGHGDDILLSICTDGQSAALVEAAKIAHERGLHIIALNGKDGGELAMHLSPDDIEIRIPSQSTARIQEMHRLTLHCLCDLIDHQLLGG